MGFILEKIEEAIKELLIGWIESNMTNMFTDVNDKVGTIAAEVGKTPSSWDSSIYQMIRGLSENVIVPIAGIIITFVLCYELISMITEKNNLHDMDTWMFFKWFFKAAVAIYLVTNTFDIVMAVFDIGQNVVTGAAGVISGDTNIDIESTLEQMRASMETMGIGELLGLSIETLLISLCLKIMSILITVILYGRMIEIYCTVSIAPIPIATMSNREWGSIGTNYLKGLFALAFQGFLIMVCVAIYAVLINNMIIAANRGQYPLGAVLGGGIHGHPLLLPVQDRFAREVTIQCPLRKEGQLEEILRDLCRPSVAVPGLLEERAWPFGGKPLSDHAP